MSVRYYVDGPVPHRNGALIGSLSAASRKAKQLSVSKGFASVRTSVLDGYRVVMVFRNGTKERIGTSHR